jgi:hypothetical protein
VLLVCVVLIAAVGCLYPGAEVPYVQTPTDVERLRGVTAVALDAHHGQLGDAHGAGIPERC